MWMNRKLKKKSGHVSHFLYTGVKNNTTQNSKTKKTVYCFFLLWFNHSLFSCNSIEVNLQGRDLKQQQLIAAIKRMNDWRTEHDYMNEFMTIQTPPPTSHRVLLVVIMSWSVVMLLRLVISTINWSVSCRVELSSFIHPFKHNPQ